MKIVITGGHLSPALSVIENLPDNTNILFIGRKFALEGDEAVSLEKQTAENLKIPFKSITTGRVQRKFTKYTPLSLLKLPIGFYQAYTILKEFKPDVVMSFGGYVSIPVGLAAYFLKIPLVLHEQTLEAGFANKTLSFFAQRICVSWESSLGFFPEKKTILTGNPLRKEFLESRLKRLSFISEEFEQEKLPTIYITGGSLGSHAINVLIEGALPALLHSAKIIHQTGDSRTYKDYERLVKKRSSLSKSLKNRYVVTKFVKPSDVYTVMKLSDLVIARSGINTITELLFVNKMSLLIPLPYSQNNEQKKNALFLKSKGLAEIVDQETASSSHLLSVVERMFKNTKKYSLQNPDTEVKKSAIAGTKIVSILSSL